MKLEEFPISDDLKQCSCCDYYSLAERSKCLICPACYWEDDCDNPNAPKWDDQSDLNKGLTLREARNNFIKYGASSVEWIGIVISKEERDILNCENRSV